jgi:hypothetical protein
MAISILSFSGVIKPTLSYSKEDVAHGLQNFLVCIEMLIAAIMHRLYFSAEVGSGHPHAWSCRPARCSPAPAPVAPAPAPSALALDSRSAPSCRCIVSQSCTCSPCLPVSMLEQLQSFDAGDKATLKAAAMDVMPVDLFRDAVTHLVPTGDGHAPSMPPHS